MTQNTTQVSSPTTAEMLYNTAILQRDLYRLMTDPRRDLNAECGYPDIITPQHYWDMYDRQGPGTRVVDIYPEECAQITPEVLEKEDGDATPWEESWVVLREKLQLQNILLTADKLSGVGHYGILLLGFNDGKPLAEPVEGVDLRTGAKVGKGAAKRTLLYVRAFAENVLTISEYETDTTSPRYGQPVRYLINMAQDTSNGSSSVTGPDGISMSVHWTRVIHIAEGKLNSTVFGTPRMKNVFDRLCDLRKICGGSGEMFWKGGFPGISFETQPGVNAADLGEDEKKNLRTEFSNYQNNLQRYLALSGMTAKSLAPQVADPTAHIEANVKLICASKGIPYRIFLGSEEAKLAGESDANSWAARVHKRRIDYVGPCILRPFIERLIAVGVLEDVPFVINWGDAKAKQLAEVVKIGAMRTEALAKYIAGDGAAVVAPMDYLTHFLGFETAIAEGILKSTGDTLALSDGAEDEEEMKEQEAEEKDSDEEDAE